MPDAELINAKPLFLGCQMPLDDIWNLSISGCRMHGASNSIALSLDADVSRSTLVLRRLGMSCFIK